MAEREEEQRCQTAKLMVTVLATNVWVGAVAFMVGASLAPPATGIGKPWLYDYQTLVTGILAVVAAFGAAWTAWLGVQRQLRHAEEMRSFPERRAKDTFIEQFHEFSELLYIYWNSISDIMNNNLKNDEIQPKYFIYDSIISEFENLEENVTIIIPLLSPIDQIIAKNTIKYVRSILDQCRITKIKFTDDDEIDHLISVITSLSHVRVALSKFDDRLAVRLRSCSGVTVHWEPMSTLLREHAEKMS